jgi:hypothetical protein
VDGEEREKKLRPVRGGAAATGDGEGSKTVAVNPIHRALRRGALAPRTPLRRSGYLGLAQLGRQGLFSFFVYGFSFCIFADFPVFHSGLFNFSQCS